MSTSVLRILLLVLLLLPGIAGAASFITLGDLPGGTTFSRAFAISADGSVVVGNSVSGSNFRSEAFRWTSAEGMVGLAPFPSIYSSYAHGISGDGSVIIGVSEGSPFRGAFQWTAAGGMVPLVANLSNINARAISYDGSVVVGSNGGTGEAFRWTSAGGIIGLGDLPGGVLLSTAYGVSGDGTVVVGTGTTSADPAEEAFRWTAVDGMVGLGDLVSDGNGSIATAVSADGSVIAGVGNTSGGSPEAFRWTAGDGMVGLGDLPGGRFGSEATAVSSDGSVVVGVGQTDNGPGGNATDEAFIWTSQGGMQRLYDVLVAQGATGLDGWTLLDARGVSADGTAVVGMAEAPDRTRLAYLARVSPVPIPPAAWLFGSALGVMAWMRRK